MNKNHRLFQVSQKDVGHSDFSEWPLYLFHYFSIKELEIIMIIINEGEKKITQLLHEKRVEGIEYRLSNCVIKENTSQGLLLCNTISGELVLLSSDEKQGIEKLPGRTPSLLSELIMHGYVVPLNYNEKLIVNQLRSIIWKRLSNYYRSFVVLPTSYCNARCFYCYESGYKHINMTEEIADNLVDFIVEHYDGKRVSISWFGGEPLLGERIISDICSELNKRNVIYTSKMVSNGYLFNRQLIKKAIDLWKLSVVQITLDGTEQIYNQTKSYVGITDNAYRRVLNNIKELLIGGVSINIRINLDKHNKNNVIDLINELDQIFDDKRLLSVYISVLNEDVGFSPLSHAEGEIEELSRIAFELNNVLIHKGFKNSTRKLPALRLNNCMADSEDQLLCSPDGILGKCEHYIDQYSVGSLKDGISNTSMLEWWKEKYEFDECHNCPLIAECVKLKNCPVNKPYCNEFEKEARINSYKRAMRTMCSSHAHL